MYPVVLFDALGVKIRDNGVVRNKAVYLALGAVFRATTLQRCIVHLIRNRLDYASSIIQFAILYEDRFVHPSV